MIYVNNQCLPWEEGELCSNSIFYPNFNHTYLCQMLSVTFSSKAKYIYCDWPPTQVQDSSISPLSMWNSSFGSKINWDYYYTFFFKKIVFAWHLAPWGNLLRSIPFLMSGHLNFNFFKLWVRHFSTQISIMDAQIWFISIAVKLTNISLTVFMEGPFWPMSRHEN